MAGQFGIFHTRKGRKIWRVDKSGNNMGGWAIGVVPTELIGQVKQLRNVPVVMVKRRAVPVGDVSSVSIETKIY